MNKSENILILSAVDEKVRLHRRTTHALELTAAAAEASWETRKELAPDSYDGREHQKVTEGYRVQIKAARANLEKWERAYDVALERYVT